MQAGLVSDLIYIFVRVYSLHNTPSYIKNLFQSYIKILPPQVQVIEFAACGSRTFYTLPACLPVLRSLCVVLPGVHVTLPGLACTPPGLGCTLPGLACTPPGLVCAHQTCEAVRGALFFCLLVASS